MPKVHIVVSENLLADFKLAAEKREQTVSSQIRVLMREFVDAYNNSPAGKAQAKATKAEQIADAKERARVKQHVLENVQTILPVHGAEMVRDFARAHEPDYVEVYEQVLAEMGK